jgi:hypothetical protein
MPASILLVILLLAAAPPTLRPPMRSAAANGRVLIGVLSHRGDARTRSTWAAHRRTI